MKTNAPPLLAVSMALRMRRGNAEECIAQWRRFRALVEATGYLPLGKYPLCIALAATGVTYKTTTIKNTPTLLAIPMAMGLIEKVQRFNGSHWMLPSGKYLLW